MALDLITNILNPTLEGVKGLISEFHLSPDDKLKAEQAMAQIEQQAKAQAFDQEVKLNQIAGDNIQSEAKTGDKFTERARPAFLWLVYFILVFNYFLLPTIQLFKHVPLAPITLPAELWFLFTSGYLGYVTARTVDKQQSLNGNSSIQLPFGIKVENKS